MRCLCKCCSCLYSQQCRYFVYRVKDCARHFRSWKQIMCDTGPSPRSGHRSVVWKNFMVTRLPAVHVGCSLTVIAIFQVTFGGFYDTVRESKWCVLELSISGVLPMSYTLLGVGSTTCGCLTFKQRSGLALSSLSPRWFPPLAVVIRCFIVVYINSVNTITCLRIIRR